MDKELERIKRDYDRLRERLGNKDDREKDRKRYKKNLGKALRRVESRRLVASNISDS
jgi:hypothetical protein